MSNPYRDKLLSVGVISKRSGSVVTEGRDAEGRRTKSTKDELGNVVTERANDRQDVTINAPHITVKTSTTEER